MKSRLTQAFLPLTLWCCCAAANGVNVLVLDLAGRPISDVVVVARPDSALPAGGEAGERPHAEMDQRNREFVPHVLVIESRTWVDFPNSDTVSHQVYSFSQPKRFQLPLYRGSTHPPVFFDQAGIVTLGCNIHDNMLGFIYVADSPWFGKTDLDGRWLSGDLPPGRYDLRIWSPRFKEAPESLERTVEVTSQSGPIETFRLAHRLKSEWNQPTDSKTWEDY